MNGSTTIRQVFSITPWLYYAMVGVWTLVVHSYPLIQKVFFDRGDIPFATHLLLANVLFGICLFNTVVTPLITSKKFRKYVPKQTLTRIHCLLGQVAMGSGIGSLLVGGYCAWWPWRKFPRPPLGFCIFISSFGLAQYLCQSRGYYAIQKYRRSSNRKDLLTHVVCMTALLGVACVGPSVVLMCITLPHVPDGMGVLGVLLAIGLVIPLANLHVPDHQTLSQAVVM